MKYIVTGKSVSIYGGVLTLSKELVTDRAHCLKPLTEKNKYEVIKPVTFKQGQEFGFDGELPKSAVLELNDGKSLKDPKKAAAEKAAAEKAAAEKAAASNKGNQ